MGVRLFLLLWFVVLAAVAAIFHLWAGLVAAGIAALALFPQVIVSIRAAVKAQPQPEPRLYLPVSLSRAQQFVAGMALVGVPLFAWRVLEDGWLAVAIIGPLVGIWAAWIAALIRHEGWSGEKSRKQ